MRIATLAYGLLSAFNSAASGQSQPERFWIAGRYDGNRIIVYFEAVKFKGTVPKDARKIAEPVVGGFFEPVELPLDYIARYQQTPGAERFSLGEQYDLLTGDGGVVTITLATLVGTEGDEEVGNDSYIGALGTVADRDVGYLRKDYFAVRRHKLVNGPNPIPKSQGDFAHLLDQPLRFSIQSRIVALLTQRMKMIVSADEWNRVQNASPRFEVRALYLANGDLRYYAKADWSSGKGPTDESNDVLAAWLAPAPALRILAVETRLSPEGLNSELPGLLNVLDLGGGRTGLVVSFFGEDSRALRLVEYRDNTSLPQMRHLQQIEAGE